MVPRISYFSLVMDKVVRHFSRSLDEANRDGKDLWLDFDGQALKLHWPVGLLWDLIDPKVSEKSLPWNLTLHFSNFPEDKLVRCSNQKAMEAMFIAYIKEADQLKHRGDIMSNLLEKDHKALLSGFVNSKFDQFWSINRKLMDFGTTNSFRFIPMRLYLISEHGKFITKLVKPLTQEGDPVKLFDFLNSIISSLNIDSKTLADSKLITHGISIPFETPLIWMSCHLSYPDNFIHLIIQTNTN